MSVLGAIDIGTNSVRLVVVDIHADGTWTVLDNSREQVRLGEGEFVGGKQRLTDAAVARCAHVCARFADIAAGYGAKELIALATAATREADNQDDFVDRVAAASKGAVDVRVISGHEEARLIFLGVTSGIELPETEKALFMDIGGGSTELIVGDKYRYHFLDSLKMGAIRLTGEVVENPSKVISPSTWHKLQRTVRSIVEPASRRIKREKFGKMFGSSGTIMALADIASRRHKPEGATTLRNFELALGDVQQISQMLCKLPLDQRKKVPGLAPERADIIIAGAAIAQTVMETVGAHSIFISDRGLREGIVVDYILRDGSAAGISSDIDADLFRDASVRVRSARRLARRCQVDEAHAATVTKLALQLFSETKALGLHCLGDDERELLSYGALLHDCGFFVSHTGHHLHSYYLIRHSELLGFNDLEVEVIAQIALYHRKSLPKHKHESFEALPPKEQNIVRVLSCLLRVAEALDRSHLGLIQSARLLKTSKGEGLLLDMVVAPDADASLEYWAAEAQEEAFKKTFGVNLNVTHEVAFQPPVELFLPPPASAILLN